MTYLLTYLLTYNQLLCPNIPPSEWACRKRKGRDEETMNAAFDQAPHTPISAFICLSVFPSLLPSSFLNDILYFIYIHLPHFWVPYIHSHCNILYGDRKGNMFLFICSTRNNQLFRSAFLQFSFIFWLVIWRAVRLFSLLPLLNFASDWSRKTPRKSGETSTVQQLYSPERGIRHRITIRSLLSVISYRRRSVDLDIKGRKGSVFTGRHTAPCI